MDCAGVVRRENQGKVEANQRLSLQSGQFKETESLGRFYLREYAGVHLTQLYGRRIRVFAERQ